MTDVSADQKELSELLIDVAAWLTDTGARARYVDTVLMAASVVLGNQIPSGFGDALNPEPQQGQDKPDDRIDQ